MISRRSDPDDDARHELEDRHDLLARHIESATQRVAVRGREDVEARDFREDNQVTRGHEDRDELSDRPRARARR